MVRRIDRSYTFTEREVAEALIAWLKSKDMPAPQYVADTPCTKWRRLDGGGLSVEWTDESEMVF